MYKIASDLLWKPQILLSSAPDHSIKSIAITVPMNLKGCNFIQSKMKLFQTIRKNLAIIYFLPIETDSWWELFKQHLSCFVKSVLSLISLFAYLFYVAETLNEFMYSVFLSAVSIFIAASFTSSVFKTSVMFDIFAHADEALHKSK